MLHPVADRRAARPREPRERARRGAWDDHVGLLRLAALEDARALHHERTGLSSESPGDAFEPDERRRSVTAVHHEVFDVALALDVTGERLDDAGARELREILTLAIRLLVPALDRETRVGGLLHGVDDPGEDWRTSVPLLRYVRS